jgi:hypothetical protein
VEVFIDREDRPYLALRRRRSRPVTLDEADFLRADGYLPGIHRRDRIGVKFGHVRADMTQTYLSLPSEEHQPASGHWPGEDRHVILESHVRDLSGQPREIQKIPLKIRTMRTQRELIYARRGRLRIAEVEGLMADLYELRASFDWKMGP